LRINEVQKDLSQKIISDGLLILARIIARQELMRLSDESISKINGSSNSKITGNSTIELMEVKT